MSPTFSQAAACGAAADEVAAARCGDKRLKSKGGSGGGSSRCRDSSVFSDLPHNMVGTLSSFSPFE